MIDPLKLGILNGVTPDMLRRSRPWDLFRESNVGMLSYAQGYLESPITRPKGNLLTNRGLRGHVQGAKRTVGSMKSFLKTGWKYSMGPMAPIIAGLSAYQATQAPEGEKAATFVSGMTGNFAGAAIGGLMFGGVGAVAGNILLGRTLSEEIHNGITRVMKRPHRIQSLELGSVRYDFGAARTMRQRAVQEMSGSLLNARQILGSEAAFLHT